MQRGNRSFCAGSVCRKTNGILGEIVAQGLSLDAAESYLAADDTLVILATEPAVEVAGDQR